MHAYRTHTCGALRLADAGKTARLSGWVHRKRDHGQLLFVDLRDHYGVTQTVIDVSSPIFKQADALKLESVVTVTGTVVNRSPETVNPKLPTGEVEVQIAEIAVRSEAEPLPFPVNTDAEYPEEMRLKYRFLDLRREAIHQNIILRSKVIASIRRRMIEQGFTEFQTAPVFRDEASRADRSPGEFYQLDLEMSFVTQEDVFAALEPVLGGVFEEFGRGRPVTRPPFPRIPFDEAMLKYGTDKPDLRNPIEMCDAAEVFRGSGFAVFAGAIEKGSAVRAIPAPGAASRPRSFFDKLNDWARGEGAPGLGYIVFAEGAAKGPIAKFLDAPRLDRLKTLARVGEGDAVFFVCDKPEPAEQLAGAARMR